MYIAPNTTIKILRNVPLDLTYDHTIYFAPDSYGNTAQYNFFSSKTKYTLTEQSYQRVKRGWVRVGIVADNLYDCNYIMFQNTNFGNKWFYAFIKTVEYINNAVSEIEFEIDVMQTWNSNYTLDRCFVEREHSAEGDKLSLYTAESLEAGVLEYRDNPTEDINMNDMTVVILSTPPTPPDNEYIHGLYFNNTYFAVNIEAVDLTCYTTEDVDAIVTEIIHQNREIIAMYQYPSAFNIQGQPIGLTQTLEITTTRPNSVGGGPIVYIPRNKKLLFYPFSFIRVSANGGKYQDYMYENFDFPYYKFAVSCIKAPEANVVIYPKDYKNLSKCYEEKMIVSDFPICAWATNAFEQWWANNKWGLLFDGISSALTLGTSALINPASAMKQMPSIAGNSVNIIGEFVKAKNAPNTVSGNISTGNINAALGQQFIRIYNMSITSERATVLDEYFDRYGYATGRNKVPNRNVRPHWCYTKTLNCSITGSIPCDDARKICDIYDHGITFWKNGSEVCNYSLDNTINEGVT